MTVQELIELRIPYYPDADGGLWYWDGRTPKAVKEADDGERKNTR